MNANNKTGSGVTSHLVQSLALLLVLFFVLVGFSARAQSSNADLSNLTLSSGTLAPAFASGTLSYTAYENSATPSIARECTPSVLSAEDCNRRTKVNVISLRT